tara:strand:+ start:8672 stop:8854 length:183 start_codon:yes stop_codon:yes gene_type:complete
MEDDSLLLALQINEAAARLLLKSVDLHIKSWAGGDPAEQEGLFALQNRLRGAVLEYQMRK